MSTLYNALLNCANAAIHAASSLPVGGAKTRRFVRGTARAMHAMERFEPGDECYWLHCSSLGEYAIARPLMEELKRRRPDCRIALTFFSPTGVEALAGRANLAADYVGYLPADTRGHARRLLDALRPRAAMFMVSEYWPNYLLELKRRGIPTFLVSAIFGKRAPHYRKISGRVFRESLQAYTCIFTLDSRSVDNLRRLGYDRARQCGDPLVDNALKVAATPWHSASLEEFCAKGRTLICGSISDDNDIALVAAQINAHPQRRYLLVPHEVDNAHIERLESALSAPSRRLSAYDPKMTENVLIVDNIGQLAYLYRLGVAAYIGGGFTSKLHSLLEASVYGLPVAFGPRTERKVVPQLLMAIGVASMTVDAAAFEQWAERMFSLPEAEMARLRRLSLNFCRQSAGATDVIIDEILKHSL